MALAELDRLVLELLVGELLEALFEVADGLREILQSAKQPTLAHSEDALENVGQDKLRSVKQATRPARENRRLFGTDPRGQWYQLNAGRRLRAQ